MHYAQGMESNGFDVALLAYDARWHATDQVASRAVMSGAIGRFGTLDPTSGGETSRYSLSARWAARGDATHTKANVFAARCRLDFFSNFSYFDDPDRRSPTCVPAGASPRTRKSRLTCSIFSIAT